MITVKLLVRTPPPDLASEASYYTTTAELPMVLVGKIVALTLPEVDELVRLDGQVDYDVASNVITLRGEIKSLPYPLPEGWEDAPTVTKKRPSGTIDLAG